MLGIIEKVKDPDKVTECEDDYSKKMDNSVFIQVTFGGSGKQEFGGHGNDGNQMGSRVHENWWHMTSFSPSILIVDQFRINKIQSPIQHCNQNFDNQEQSINANLEA